VVVLLVLLGCSGGAHGTTLPPPLHCKVFPATNPWNRPVDKLPVAANSARIIHSIGLNKGLHPDFGSGKYAGGPLGIPYTFVSKRTRRVQVAFSYGRESDPGPYPIPRHVKIEGGRHSTGDRHAILLDDRRCRLYELYTLYPRGKRRWRAVSGAIWNLRSNKLRPPGWTSADAAGLPIFPGLVRWGEVARGRISHALRFTVKHTRRAYIYPARHFASASNNPDYPPMGLRVRLKANVNISHFPRQARIVLKALKRYGMVVADNGADWSISGAPDRHWSNDALHTLGEITGRDFEVVDTSRLRP
jgi:hypothetical protein